jgi:hypothetical protein
MRQKTKTRAGIAALIYGLAIAVMFGAGLIFVLSVPGLHAHRGFAIAALAVASGILAAPAAWLIAPHLRARFWRARRKAGAIPPRPGTRASY